MGKLNQTKHSLAAKKWEALIADQKASGLKVMEWCRIHNLSRHAFYYWHKVLQEEAIENLPCDIKTELTISNTPVSFKKLEVAEPIQDLNSPIVIHANGLAVEINDNVNPKTLEVVLLALRSVC